jgi:hypothetical protein
MKKTRKKASHTGLAKNTTKGELNGQHRKQQQKINQFK